MKVGGVGWVRRGRESRDEVLQFRLVDEGDCEWPEDGGGGSD